MTHGHFLKNESKNALRTPGSFFRGPKIDKSLGFLRRTLRWDPRLYTLSDTPRADVAEKKVLPERTPGALWTRPKIAIFVVFGRSGAKTSANAASKQ